MKKKSNIGWWIAGLAGALWLINRHKSVSGIGKVERIKRRIYKEVSLAQDAGVDFSKKFSELSRAEMDALEHIGKDVIGWKQSKRSIESGKPYVESYYGSLRRAWNAVSGVQGIGRAYDVRNADGDVVLTWNDIKEHIQQEPDAHTLLALPPHIEPKKPKAKKPTAEDYPNRFQFAKIVWQDFRKENPYFDDNIPDGAPAFIKPLKHKHAVLADAYARNKMRIKNTRSNGKVVEVQILDGGDWMRAGSFDDYMVRYAQAILDAENSQYLDSGFDREDLDDIRRALLDKAKHMHVSVPYDDLDQYRDLMENGYIRGENRYKALELINWIMWVHQHYERGGDTYYPMYSFDTKEEALKQTGGKMKGSGFKIIPVWDVPIEKITGIYDY